MADVKRLPPDVLEAMESVARLLADQIAEQRLDYKSEQAREYRKLDAACNALFLHSTAHGLADLVERNKRCLTGESAGSPSYYESIERCIYKLNALLCRESEDE